MAPLIFHTRIRRKFLKSQWLVTCQGETLSSIYKFLTEIILNFLTTWFHLPIPPLFFFFRYRAVASWSRVQGIGIPLITAIEIVSIWILSFILAIPEAIGFVMVPFEYKGAQHKTCMLNATSKFMEVRRV